MNERIKQLVKKLGPDPVATIGNWGRVEWADNVYPQLGDQMYAAVDLQEFAELIIRGCASKANAVALDLRNHPELDGRKYVGDSILKAFGVEQ
jgi:hypothetical protein